MSISKDFKVKLDELLEQADKQGRIFLDVNSDDLNKTVEGYSAKGQENRISACCDVLYKKMKNKDKLIHATQSGDSSTLIIRFYVPRM